MRGKHPSVQWTPVVLLLLTAGAFADDVSGERHLLCTTLETQVCVESLGCQEFDPEVLNVPRFIEVDTRERRLSTTEASGERRESVAASSSREDGQLVLQGVEQGRAWSLFIDEATGWATFAAAAEGRGTTMFGACTPDDGQ